MAGGDGRGGDALFRAEAGGIQDDSAARGTRENNRLEHLDGEVRERRAGHQVQLGTEGLAVRGGGGGQPESGVFAAVGIWLLSRFWPQGVL